MEKGTILIVDDEPAVLTTLSEYFGRTYEIFTARSANEARAPPMPSTWRS